VNGGNLHINANTAIRYAISGNNGTNTITLNSGAITFYSDNANTVGGSGVLDLHQGNGGTVQNTFNLNGGTLSVFGILSANTAGTRTFNFNGGTLKAVANNTSFLNLGTGSAAANVRSGGAIIDTAGFDVTIAQALVNNGVDQDGGLTKNSNGTLTLSGSNTYTNNTTVNGGTLELAQATLAPNSTVIIASGAVLKLDFSTTNQIGALVLGGVSQLPGVYSSNSTPAYIAGPGSLVVPSPINPNPPVMQVSVSGNILTLAWPTNAGWILQSQTNSLSTGLSTNWVDVTGSAAITSTNITINPALPTAFYRLKKP
jgi:autotransporter-associated beta strand protein